MSIQELKSKLSISEVLSHYNIKIIRTTELNAHFMMIKTQACRFIQKQIPTAALAQIVVQVQEIR